MTSTSPTEVKSEMTPTSPAEFGAVMTSTNPTEVNSEMTPPFPAEFDADSSQQTHDENTPLISASPQNYNTHNTSTNNVVVNESLQLAQAEPTSTDNSMTEDSLGFDLGISVIQNLNSANQEMINDLANAPQRHAMNPNKRMDSKIAKQRLQEKMPQSNNIKLVSLDDDGDSGIPLDELSDRLVTKQKELCRDLFNKEVQVAVCPLGITERGKCGFPLWLMSKTDHCVAIVFTKDRIYLIDSKSNDYGKIENLTSITSHWQAPTDGVNCARYSGQLLLSLATQLEIVIGKASDKKKLDELILLELSRISKPSQQELMDFCREKQSEALPKPQLIPVTTVLPLPEAVIN